MLPGVVFCSPVNLRFSAFGGVFKERDKLFQNLFSFHGRYFGSRDLSLFRGGGGLVQIGEGGGQ